MTCKIIDGSAIAGQIKSELLQEVRQFRNDYGYSPGLAAVIVGKNPASELYVSKKMQACGEVGIEPTICSIPAEEDVLMHQIDILNKRKSIHGFILQLPLPIGMDPNKFFGLIDPKKDVDVFHPENVGLLVQHRPRFKPCTPHGIQVLLYRSGIQIAEKRVVVINRSNVIGKPLSSMLIQECDDFGNATVTVCHDRTPPQLLREICLESDIIVVAVGKPGFLTSDHIKPGAIVVDVGITRVGKKIFGDVDFENVSKIASAITKVPGGVGPMTVAMLLKNTVEAAKHLALHP